MEKGREWNDNEGLPGNDGENLRDISYRHSMNFLIDTLFFIL
jgi:hypothetical protein